MHVIRLEVYFKLSFKIYYLVLVVMALTSAQIKEKKYRKSK